MVVAVNKEAYKLLHDGSLALAEVERAGMRVDVDYLQQAYDDIAEEIRDRENKLKQHKVFKLWRKRFGDRTKLDSGPQLATVVYEILGHGTDDTPKTAKGQYKTDESAFDLINEPFVKELIHIKKRKKLRGTYLKGLLREVCDGYIHPFYHLNTAKSFRSSCSEPNLQNIPIRVEAIAEIIRRCFIPRRNHQLVEFDFSGIEVSIAYCYHLDPRMYEYLTDPTKDLHRDMAAECYKCSPKQVSKQTRYCGKNKFVFPQFYGDYYIDCARSLWEHAEILNLEVDGVPMREHLASQGIEALGTLDPKKKPQSGTFEHHIQRVEKRFWKKRFSVYDEWKDKWWARYLKNGGFNMLTGFHVEGLYRRNQVINIPVQGAAFHCLLWCLIRMVRWLRKNNMRTKIVGQIHDSIIADVHCKEMDDYLEKAHQVMTEDLPRAWDWIVVPLKVEAEAAPVGASWYDKKEIEL